MHPLPDRQQLQNVIARLENQVAELECRLARTNAQRLLFFVGPSLSLEEARRCLDDHPRAEFRPPIRRGDLLQGLKDGFRWIGIIDGVFHQHLAVSIQEIRYALEQGAQIYGASSMGALRAAETYLLGMIGVGKIYHWYRSETIDSDDEVAVCFDETSGKAASEPLVNIRATIELGIQEGLIPFETAQAVLTAAQDLPFPSRDYRNILKSLTNHIPGDRLNQLSQFLATEAVDLKAEDAKALISRMKEDYAHEHPRGDEGLPDPVALGPREGRKALF